MLFKVYTLYAPQHDKLFTGMTTSLTDRMISHNSDEPEEWTTFYKPWTLIHMEVFNNEDEALSRETYLGSSGGELYIRKNILPLYNFN